MIQKLEAYFMKDFIEKGGALAVFSIMLFLPVNFVRTIFMILMITVVLSHFEKRSRRSALTALPFSYSEIFWFPLVFLITIVTIVQLAVSGIIGLPVYYAFSQILYSAVFLTAYYAIFTLFSIVGLAGSGFLWFFWVADIIFGSIQPSQNLYRLISPLYQGNEIAAILFSIILLSISAYLFSKKGVTKRWKRS